MVSLSFLSSHFLLLSLCVVLLISPAHSLDCTSQKFTNNKLFDNCTDLPTLKTYLHYTYNASNSSLSIAFKGPPAKADGWVGWGINPSGTGMQGAQSLVAMKNGTVVVVKKFNLASYTDIKETPKLTVDVWDLSAESDSAGNFVIFASVKVPAGPSVNQIWQVGSSVKDGFPEKHDFNSANLQSKGTLELVASESRGGNTTTGTGTNSSSGYKIKELNVGFQFGLLALLGSLTVF